MRLIPTTILCLALATPLAAKPPLSQVPEIENGLTTIAIADAIRKECDGIKARVLRATNTVNALKSRALALGYSEAEIEAYVTSPAEQDRMRAKVESWLAERGVHAGRSKEMCAFGKAEIARASRIGTLLR